MEVLNPTSNLISDSNSLFFLDANGRVISPNAMTHSWSATNATVSVVSERYVTPRNYSFKLQPLDPSSTISFSLSSIIPSNNEVNRSQVQFHCRVFPASNVSAACQLTNTVSSVSASHTTSLSLSKWNTVYSPVVSVGIVDTNSTQIQFSVSINFSNHNGQVIYVTLPTLMDELGFTKNQFVQNFRKFLPSFIWDMDKVNEFPNYPFTKLFHSMTQTASATATLYSRYYEHLNGDVDVANSTNGYRFSELLNPERVDQDYEDWLSQFNGTPLYRALTASNSTNALVSGGETVEDSITWQLKNAYFGRNAGTLEAIKECAKQVLDGNKVCLVFPGGSFFTINVYTVVSETPGVTSPGETSPEVVAILELTKPMGFQLNHEAFATAALALVLDSDIYAVLDTAPLG